MEKMTFNNLIALLIQSVAECLGGEYDLTSDDVPRIIFTCSHPDFVTLGMKISVVYLVSSQQWKAFYPFPAEKQEKEYFRDIADLIAWLDEMGVDA